MEDLYQKLDEIVKFFTTDKLTGLPQQVGKFLCIPLMSKDMVHAGYLVARGTEMHFFPAASMNNIADDHTPAITEAFIQELWHEKSDFSLN